MCDVINLDARRKTPRKKVPFEVALEHAAKQAYDAGVIAALEEHRPAMPFTTASGYTFDREDLS